MQAVLLAAGSGSRMNGLIPYRHKALTDFFGHSLIERGMLALRDAGIRRFVVVTGHAGTEIERHLGDGSRIGVEIKYAFNPEWKRGNGTSVMAARPLVDSDRFVVAMADHWFDPGLAKLLVDAPECEMSAVCVDFNLESQRDPGEATKCLVDRCGVVKRVGKGLRKFNAIECGVFLFNEEIFLSLERCISRGQFELGAAVDELAKSGLLLPIDIGSLHWQDVDTPDDLVEAVDKLKRSLPGSDDGVIAANLNRKLSVPLSTFLARRHVAPNTISLASFITALFSSVAFALGEPIVGGIFAQIASVMDGSDGEVARLSFRASKAGGLLDSALDRLADGMMLGGATYWIVVNEPVLWEVLAALAALAIAPMSMIVKDRFELATGVKWQSRLDDGPARWALGSRDGRLFLLCVGGLTGQLALFMLVIGLTGSVLLVWRLSQMWGRMSQEPPHGEGTPRRPFQAQEPDQVEVPEKL